MSEGKPFINCGKLHDFYNAFTYNDETEIVFLRAFNETLRWHVLRCPEYKAWLSAYGFTNFRQIHKPFEIPLMPVSLFKKFTLSSTFYDLIKYDFGSVSYDNHDNSHIILEARSWKRLLKIISNELKSLGFIKPELKHNYICFSKDPNLKLNIINDFIFDILTSQTAHRSVFYTYKNESGNNFINWEQTLKRLSDFSMRPEPLFIIATYSELKQLCDIIEIERLKFNLSNNSAILCLSGITESFDLMDEFLIKKIRNLFGLGRSKIRNIFWVKEQMFPLITCECGAFHIPVYSKAEILEPEYMQAVEYGETGLLGLVTPFLTSYPAFSLLTNYLVHQEKSCSCGRNGFAFKFDGFIKI